MGQRRANLPLSTGTGGKADKKVALPHSLQLLLITQLFLIDTK
jgi:hypothetical protein